MGSVVLVAEAFRIPTRLQVHMDWSSQCGTLTPRDVTPEYEEKLRFARVNSFALRPLSFLYFPRLAQEDHVWTVRGGTTSEVSPGIVARCRSSGLSAVDLFELVQ